MALISRLIRLERLWASDNSPRRVAISCGPDVAESWIEREVRGGEVAICMHVKLPDHVADPFDHMTPEQRAEIRPGDHVVTYETASDGRDAHLQMHLPPWKRRPWRFSDGRAEVQDEWGVWRRCG